MKAFIEHYLFPASALRNAAGIVACTLMLAPSLSAAVNVADTETALQAGGSQATQAIENLKQAYNQNDPVATRLLGDAYLQGLGVTKNSQTAFDYFSEAARKGDKLAQLRMGESYHKGQGTDANQITAWVWLTLASEDESPVKEQAISLRDTVSQSLNEAQQDRAELLTSTIRQVVALETK
ncbi:tetratricopeptide repeat protein [Parendozoicomonas haliclonae]|uniref:Localization factor PodJL n=1 Tax=Parendozoicomonas haliclonae TaxID=1960125 RepID=A0A1X7AQX9_9GAMM|nr:SEL1-like repeat protein [Parendozoicomonas haliclonae]SMA50553.1 Localization factor PodJL [Parendozoicomonas haliclonae]